MERSLVERIKWCKREIEALKTAQNVGLGLVDFYTMTKSARYNPTTFEQTNYLITVQFRQDLDFRPFCEVYVEDSGQLSLNSTTFDSSNKKIKFRYTAGINFDIVVYVKVISVVPIISITMEAISPDD